MYRWSSADKEPTDILLPPALLKMRRTTAKVFVNFNLSAYLIKVPCDKHSSGYHILGSCWFVWMWALPHEENHNSPSPVPTNQPYEWVSTLCFTVVWSLYFCFYKDYWLNPQECIGAPFLLPTRPTNALMEQWQAGMVCQTVFITTGEQTLQGCGLAVHEPPTSPLIKQLPSTIYFLILHHKVAFIPGKSVKALP